MDKDFVRDNNPTAIYYADIQVGLPEYVKQATVITPEELDQLHVSAFADPVHRLHPVHNKAAALLSAVYLAGNNSVDDKTWERVKKACVFHQIEQDLEKVISVFDHTKSAAEEKTQEQEKWAVQIQWNESEVGSYYPINNAEEVKEAAVNLDQDFAEDRMPVDLFRTGAINIMKAAEENDVPLSSIPWTVQQAGDLRYPNPAYATTLLYTRKLAGVPDEGMEIYRQCASIAEEAGTDEATKQAADLWLALDEQHGIDYRKQANGMRIPSPYECFYTGMRHKDLEKIANSHVILHGVMIPAEEFVEAVYDQDAKTVKQAVARMFSNEANASLASLLDGVSYVLHEKYAASDYSNSLAELPVWQQKRLLEIVLNNAV